MGQNVRGGVWCDYCNAPTVGVKSTHRLRGAVIAATLLPTSGASGLFARSDAYVCERCGQPVRRATDEDFAGAELDSDANAEERAAWLDASAPRTQDKPDWRT